MTNNLQKNPFRATLQTVVKHQPYNPDYFAAQLRKSDPKVAWQYGHIFALAGVVPSGRVLDIGCGAGPGLRYLAAQGIAAFGIDLVSYPLLKAQHLAPAAGLVQGNAGVSLPFASASFDLLLASELIEHLPDGRPLLAECSRVLRPGGYAVITTPNLWDVRRVFARLTGRVWSGDTDPTHINLYTPPRLAREMASAGLVRVRWRTGIKPVFWLSSRRLRLRFPFPYPPVIGNGLLAVGEKP
ncbi:MAG: class I SAM-dependent methyltransferase [Chloroflexaceae bacterium]|nr:class I SAM-dependent methyltransferase [Chloroflexaceae bacterium]